MSGRSERLKSQHSRVKSLECPVTRCLVVIGGKWKPLLLFLIANGINRFGGIHRNMSSVSKHILTKDLRELEKAGVITRRVFAEVPPRVEYSLTPRGQSLMQVVRSMKRWGEFDLRS